MVAASCGAEVGYTENSTTADPSSAGIVVTGVTAATPGCVWIVVASWVIASACAGSVVWATTSSGPLNPGPNPWASRSYAVRVVLPIASFP